MRPWCSLIDKLCTDLPPASRTKGHSESTSLLGARPKSCAHCLVLAETARLCGTSAEGFEYHDPSGRSGLPSARMFWRLWCVSQSPGKLGSKPRGMTSHTNSCCEFRVQSLDKSLRVHSRSERTNMVRFGPIRRKTDQSVYILAPCVCKGSGELSVTIDRHFGVLNVSDVFAQTIV